MGSNVDTWGLLWGLPCPAHCGPRGLQSRDPFSAGTCTEHSPALNRAPGTIANSAETALLRAGQSLISAGTGTNEVVFDLWCSAHAYGANKERKWIDTITVRLSEVPAWAWAELSFLFVVLGRSLVLHFLLHLTYLLICVLSSGQILSCLPGAPASMLQEKKTTSTTGSAPQKIKQPLKNVTPALTTVRRDEFSPCLSHPLRCCKKKKKMTCTTGSAPQKSNNRFFSATAVPRPYSVATTSLMSAWRTRLLECAAIIAIFAFAR